MLQPAHENLVCKIKLVDDLFSRSAVIIVHSREGSLHSTGKKNFTIFLQFYCVATKVTDIKDVTLL